MNRATHPARATVPGAIARLRSSRPTLVLLGLAIAASGCVSEVVAPPTVTLPKEAFRYERFLEATTLVDADRITLQLVHAYRKDIGIATTEGSHLRRETPDRIELENKDPDDPSAPLRLSLRNLHLSARQSIVVVFSDLPLLRNEDPPVLVLLSAEGLVRFRGDGVELLADRVIARNDEVKGFGADGRPIEARMR